MAINRTLFSSVYGAAPSRIAEIAPTKEPTPLYEGIRPFQKIPGNVVTPVDQKPSSVSSNKSSNAYHSSLFRAFNLQAKSTYNFYIDGEENEPTKDTPGSLSSLPRYVTLSWRTAPSVESKVKTQKGTRKFITPEILTFPKAATIDVAITAVANGYISPGSVSTLLVDPPVQNLMNPTKIDEDAFLLADRTAGKMAVSEVGSKSSEFSVIPLRAGSTALSTIVNFVDPSIAGAFDANRLSIATDPLHLTMVGSLAKVIGSLEVISEFNQDVPMRNPPPDFTGNSDAPTVMYIGYLIERYDMRPDGSLELGRTITISDITQDEFIDQQVSYGGVYTYRMRSIVQWTRNSDLDFAGFSTIDKVTAFSSRTLPPMASFYAGDWCDWSKTQVLDTVPPEPPDEITVRPVSWKGEVRVSWKVGNNPQLDLTSFKLVRAMCMAGRISEWKEVATFAVANGSYVDKDVRPYEEGQVSYVYSLYSTSYHGVDSPLGDQIEAKLSNPGSSEEFPVVQWGVTGPDRTEHPSAKEKPVSTEIKVNKRLTFYCRSVTSGHPLRKSFYLIEVRSMSTGERSLVTLDVDATDIGVRDA